MLNSVNCSTIICSPTVEYLCSREKPLVKPMAPGSIFIILISYYLVISFSIYFAFILLCIFYHKNTKNIILSYLSDLTLVSGPIGIDNPYLRWLRGFICFVQVRGTRAQPPTGLIPWFSKTEGNIYATLLHHPFLFGEIQRSAEEVARRISGAVAGEFVQKSTYQVPITIPISRITLFAICLSFSSPPLHPCRFICPLSLYPPSLFASFFLLAFCLLVC